MRHLIRQWWVARKSLCFRSLSGHYIFGLLDPWGMGGAALENCPRAQGPGGSGTSFVCSPRAQKLPAHLLGMHTLPPATPHPPEGCSRDTCPLEAAFVPLRVLPMEPGTVPWCP